MLLKYKIQMERRNTCLIKSLAQVPPKVEYSITAKGKRTIPLITVIRKYGLEMMKEKGISTEKEGIGNKRKSRK